MLTANFVENADSEMEVRRIDASGNVEIRTQTEFVTGDEGVYYVDREIATLSGKVKITRDENQLNGEYAEVNLATGISKLKGAAPGSESSGRVTAIVLPKSAPKPDDLDPDEPADNAPEEAPEEAPKANGGS